MSTSGWLRLLAGSSLVVAAGCATLGASSGGKSSAPFAGGSAVQARIKTVHDKGTVALPCFQKHTEAELGGTMEVTADADGNVTARSVRWQGPAEVESCILAAARAIKLDPLPGAPVSSLWEFKAPHAAAPGPINESAMPNSEMADAKKRMDVEVEACAQRFLPPEYPAQVEVDFFVFPGGKVAAPNVVASTANDGAFDGCVLQVLTDKALPDPHYDGPYPFKLNFRVGKIEAR